MKILTTLGIAVLAVGLIVLTGQPPDALASAAPVLEAQIAQDSAAMSLIDQIVFAVVLLALVALAIRIILDGGDVHRRHRQHGNDNGQWLAGEPRPPG